MADGAPRPRTASGSDRPSLPVRLTRYAARSTGVQRAALHTAVQRVRRSSPPPAGFDEGRDLGHQWRWSACYAPLTSMYLDQFGLVRACCQNTEHPLGNVATSTLREIWDGAPAHQLRRALERSDLELGCDFCAWQIAETGRSAFARVYDYNAAGPRAARRWPRQLEFAISNTCNLQCVMCNGDWSSSIRARREGRAPLPPAYPERFYDELVDFIPHLRDAKFTGGEPFLGREPLRVMDLLVDHGAPGLVLTAVTNATIFNDRVERILGSLTPWIVVSLDGGTAESYERIRVGASFDQVLANLDRFAAIVAERGVGINLTHCLMVDNWSSFPELLRLAEERGLDVAINTVRFPEAHSLYQLPEADLRGVVAALDARTPEMERDLTGGRLTTWHEQLAALGARSASTEWPSALGQIPDRLVSTGPSREVQVDLLPRPSAGT